MTGRLWRYTCPDGHYSWRPRSEGYYCMRCEEGFEELVEQDRSDTGFFYGVESGAWGEDA